MTDKEKFMAVARDMAAMLHSDSHIPIGESTHLLCEALSKDDKLPTLYEKECLIFGGPVDSDGDETDGMCPAEVEQKFKHTNAAIESFF